MHTQIHTHTHTTLLCASGIKQSSSTEYRLWLKDTFAYTAISSLEKRPQIQIVGNTYEENF